MRSKLILHTMLVMGCLLITACAQTEPVQSTAEISSAAAQLAAELQGLSLDQFYEHSFKALTLTSPETVLEVGLTDIYAVTEVELDDISDAYQQEVYQMIAVILEGLKTYDRASLTPGERISYDIYQWYLQDLLDGQAFMYHDYPATYFPTTAVHEQLIRFFTDIHPITSLQDARDYLTRLELVGTKIDQLIEGLDQRQQAGSLPPKFAVDWAMYTTLNDLVVSPPEHTPFYQALEKGLDDLQGVTDSEKQALLDQAEEVIRNAVLPAYDKLRDYMLAMDTYPGDDSGVWRLPDGTDYYAYRLHHYTTTDLTADEIHQLGLQELRRIHAEMRQIFDTLGYPQDESLAELFDRVAEDSGTVKGYDVLDTYEGIIDQAEANLEAAFDVFPRGDVVVIGDDYGGFYIRGSIDGSRPGAFYAKVTGSGEQYYAMPTLAYHEAIPGHHFQITIAQELTGLPSFRQGLTFTAYAEGWALYAERLAWELGWYADDPYGNLGRLQAEAFRATRLVVDTGLHAKGWTFEQAQSFFTENTGFEVGDSVNPQNEIARYLVWPGQSTAYFISFMKMLELRQKVIDQLGDQFDLKEYHHLILTNGSMPMEILEQVVDAYIAEKLSGS